MLHTDYKAVYINAKRRLEEGDEVISQDNLHVLKEVVFTLWSDHSLIPGSSVVIWRVKSIKHNPI